MSKQTICLDFDGVIHSYTSKWQGAAVIPDPPVPGAREAIAELRAHGFEVVVYSTRCATLEGATAVEQWLMQNHIVVDRVCAGSKPPALVYLDDRAVRFEGNWNAARDEILRVIEQGTWQGKARR